MSSSSAWNIYAKKKRNPINAFLHMIHSKKQYWGGDDSDDDYEAGDGTRDDGEGSEPPSPAPTIKRSDHGKTGDDSRDNSGDEQDFPETWDGDDGSADLEKYYGKPPGPGPDDKPDKPDGKGPPKSKSRPVLNKDTPPFGFTSSLNMQRRGDNTSAEGTFDILSENSYPLRNEERYLSSRSTQHEAGKFNLMPQPIPESYTFPNIEPARQQEAQRLKDAEVIRASAHNAQKLQEYEEGLEREQKRINAMRSQPKEVVDKEFDAVFQAVNRDRAEKGLPPLSEDDRNKSKQIYQNRKKVGYPVLSPDGKDEFEEHYFDDDELRRENAKLVTAARGLSVKLGKPVPPHLYQRPSELSPDFGARLRAGPHYDDPVVESTALIPLRRSRDRRSVDRSSEYEDLESYRASVASSDRVARERRESQERTKNDIIQAIALASRQQVQVKRPEAQRKYDDSKYGDDYFAEQQKRSAEIANARMTRQRRERLIRTNDDVGSASAFHTESESEYQAGANQIMNIMDDVANMQVVENAEKEEQMMQRMRNERRAALDEVTAAAKAAETAQRYQVVQAAQTAQRYQQYNAMHKAAAAQRKESSESAEGDDAQQQYTVLPVYKREHTAEEARVQLDKEMIDTRNRARERLQAFTDQARKSRQLQFDDGQSQIQSDSRMAQELQESERGTSRESQISHDRQMALDMFASHNVRDTSRGSSSDTGSESEDNRNKSQRSSGTSRMSTRSSKRDKSSSGSESDEPIAESRSKTQDLKSAMKKSEATSSSSSKTSKSSKSRSISGDSQKESEAEHERRSTSSKDINAKVAKSGRYDSPDPKQSTKEASKAAASTGRADSDYIQADAPYGGNKPNVRDNYLAAIENSKHMPHKDDPDYKRDGYARGVRTYQSLAKAKDDLVKYRKELEQYKGTDKIQTFYLGTSKIKRLKQTDAGNVKKELTKGILKLENSLKLFSDFKPADKETSADTRRTSSRNK